MFQCRTNTLKLRWRQGFQGGSVDCLLCGGEEETVRHFVMEYGELQEIRQYGVAIWNQSTGGGAYVYGEE